MDVGQIGKESGVIDQFFQELPEKAFHLGLRVVLAALAFLIGVQVIKLVRHVLHKALVRGRVDGSAISFIDSFVKFGMYFVLILTIASGLGVDASIVALLGSASVAIGLAVQGSLSNFAGGVLLLILKPFAPGDYIRDGVGNEGTVDSIDVFYTHLITPDHKRIVLPNGTSYQDDVKAAKNVLEKLLREDPAVLKDEEIRVFVDDLADSSVVLILRCWTLQGDFWETKWRLTEEVKYTLDGAGIHIPYPQLNVHMEGS